MCGIAGWLGTAPDAEERAQGLAKALRHRGPDAHGHRCWEKAALVNTRLKIIDLSPRGDQPLSNETSRIWAVLNGEIYNHRELRRWLEGRGHRFRGHSDTEVLPHLYEEHGPRLAEHLKGMFAFAVYDEDLERLLLGRDRFGIKPLFYAQIASDDGPSLAFASEIRALLELPGIDDEPSRQALFDLVALMFIPGPQTFYEGIRALEPGHTLEASFGRGGVSVSSVRYHQWETAPDDSLTLDGAATRAGELLRSAVRRQIESEVPLGSLLSGGIDSSLVSAAARSEIGSGLRTFNVKFWEKSYDETWAAQAVANHIGSHHQTLEMERGEGSWSAITSLIAHAGQPFADTSLFAANAVSRLMRQHVTVALSGDGGDEGFGGYDTFWQVTRLARLQHWPPFIRGGGASALGLLSPIAPQIARFAHHMRGLDATDNVGVVQALHSTVRPREQRRLMPGDDLEPTRRWFERQWPSPNGERASGVEQLSALVTETRVRLSLANDYLFKVDTASMREGLEVRVPMLDEDLFAFGLTLPHSLKARRRRSKVVLRELARRTLPHAVASKPKWGFGIPVGTWVSDDFNTNLKDYLLDPGSVLQNYFEPRSYVPLIEAFVRGESAQGVSREGTYLRVFALLSVQVIADSVTPLRIQRRKVDRRT